MSSTPRRILFLDITTPRPYDTITLRDEPMGGSEATLVRVAEALASRGYEVVVAQHNRIEPGVGLAKYIGFDHLDQMMLSPHAVIAFRNTQLIPYIRNLWGDAPRLFLWMQDFNQRNLLEDYEILSEKTIKILGVSKMHKSEIASTLVRSINIVKNITVDYVYNIIADDLVPDETPIDDNKFVFFSSPHKGLALTIETFKLLRNKLPKAQLYVANPGYIPDMQDLPDFVTNLGTLSHSKVIEQVRSAYCVFHINAVFPETFGIVHAEANAVGTPVLTGYHGANYEIIKDKEQMLDVRNPELVVDKIMHWKKNGRPQVSGQPQFRMSEVMKKWSKLLND